MTTVCASDRDKIRECCKDIWNLQRTAHEPNPVLYHDKSPVSDDPSMDKLLALIPSLPNPQDIDLTDDASVARLARQTYLLELTGRRLGTATSPSMPRIFLFQSLLFHRC